MYSKEINAKKIQEAKDNFVKETKETSLEYSERLSRKYGGNIFLKREDQQTIRSYKIRGAFNAVNNLSESARKKGVVCASAGNHAQGVAMSCKLFKTKGYIFMPRVTPLQKIERTKRFGGKYVEVVLEGDTFDDAQKDALKFATQKRLEYIAPFDNPKTIIGNGTVGLEIFKQLEKEGKNVDMVLVPIGGGGLIGGVGTYLKELNPKVQVVGVEAEGSASMKEALSVGRPVELEAVDVFADGVAVKKVGKINFELAKKVVDKIITIPENRICATILKLLKEEGIVLEPAGALSINALRDFSKKQLEGKNIVCILSGGNLDFNRLPDIKERYLIYKGLKKYLKVKFPQRPEALKDFVNCLGKFDNIVEFHYSEIAGSFGDARVSIETNKKENFARLFKKLQKVKIEFVEVDKK